MKFKTHNDNIEWQGGCLQGHILADYRQLKKVFGKPTEGDEYKVDAEWNILYSDGTYSTIYNYKTGKNYNGKSGTPKTKIKEWHIGGKSSESVNKVIEHLTMALGNPHEGHAYSYYKCKDFRGL